MRGRKPNKFVLKAKDKAVLLQLLHDGQTPLKVAQRAQILLYRADPTQRMGTVREKVAKTESTIWRVCQRYRQGGLPAALYDAARSGRPRVFFQK
jgi:hypothetical protein